MNKPELDKLLDIIAINKSIEKLYNTLADLEISGKKNSKEYKETKELIEAAVNITNKKWRTLDVTPKDLREFDENISELNNLNTEDFIISVCNLRESNRIRRTCMQLYYYSIVNHYHDIEVGCITPEEMQQYGYTENDFYDDDDYDELYEDEDAYFDDEEYNEDNYEQEQLNEINNALDKEDDFEYIKDKVICNTFMDYLLEAIKNEKDFEIKKELIKAKYRFMYIFTSIENQYLSKANNFTRTPLYLQLYNYKLESIEDDIEELVINPELETTMEELEYLSNINDEYFETKKNIASLMLRSILLRTYMSLNISIKSKKKLDNIKDKIKCKSPKTKKYIDKAYQSKKEFSILKKVDI